MSAMDSGSNDVALNDVKARPSATMVMLGALLLLVVALVPRLVNVGGVDPWEDEVYTFIGSGNLVPELLTWDGTRSNLHSPLIYLEVKISRAIFGNTNLGLRFPAILYGSLSVVLLYLITGRFAGWTVAFFAGLLLALNPFAIEWGRDARMYSQWLFGALVVIGLAMEAVRHATADSSDATQHSNQSRSTHGSPLDWRWWTLGFGLMLVHAWAIFGVTTIAAVALWLGLVGLMRMIRHWRLGRDLLLGAALAGGVYLFSWALVGVARLLQRVGRSKATSDESVWSRFPREISAAMADVTGYLPWIVAGLIWLAAIAGLVLLWRKGQGPLALLVLLVGGLSMATFPMIAKQHFFVSRYVIIALLPLALGLGSMAAWAWNRRGPQALVWRGMVIVLLLVLVGLWMPVTRQIVTEPRVEYSLALGPVSKAVKAGDAMVLLPEWYLDLDPWYKFKGPAIAVMPPADTLIFLKPPAAGEPVPGGFDRTFESVFPAPAQTGDATGRDDDAGANAVATPPLPTIATPPATPVSPAPALPGATWVVMVEPLQKDEGRPRIDGLDPLLLAYGIDPKAVRLQLQQHISSETMIITFRVTRNGIDEIHTGGGRRAAVWR